jgi:HEAT repeat protein
LIVSLVTAVLLLLTGCGSGAPGKGPSGVETRYEGATLDEWRERIQRLDLKGPLDETTYQGLRSILLDRDAPWFTRRQAALTLGRFGERAAKVVPDLIHLLDEPWTQPETAAPLWALKALSFFGTEAKTAAPKVVELFEDRRQPFLFRLMATETLGRIGGSDPAAIPALIHAAGDARLSDDEQQSLDLRVAVIESLELPAPPDALPVLIDAAENPAERVRRAAIKTIGTLGSSGRPAIEALATRVLFDESPLLQEAAGRALVQIGPEAVPALQQLTEWEEPAVRLIALNSLGSLGTVARPAADAVKARFDDDDPAVAVAALRADWQITKRPETVLPLLLARLSSDNRNERKLASETLILMGAAAATLRPQLERLSATGSPEEQSAARHVLNRLPDADAKSAD